MEQFEVIGKTRELVFFRRVDDGREIIVTKKFLRTFLKNVFNPDKISCERLVSIEYDSREAEFPCSINGILKYHEQ